MDPLIVPVRVDAFALTENVRKHETIMRWEPSYDSRFQHGTDAEPPPFNNYLLDEDSEGVYLHWELPEALRCGRLDPATSEQQFPPVPNRWLAIRYSGPTGKRHASAAWVVVSDHLQRLRSNDPDGTDLPGTSSVADPRSATVEQAFMGRLHDLMTGEWVEPVDQKAPPLTAATGGLPAFVSFQPYNQDVFSLHDPLTDISKDTVSYLLVGWYSKPVNDAVSPDNPVNVGKDTAAILAALGWTAGDKPQPSASSLHLGTVLGLRWDHKATNPPESDKPADGSLRLGIGFNAVEATAAVAKAGGANPRSGEVLTALCHGMLDILAEPTAAATLAFADHDAGFGRHSGGQRWQVVDTPDAANRKLTDKETAAERAWLNQLNQAQLDYDRALAPLWAKQERLYFMWSLTNQDKADFGSQLDPTKDGTLANQVQADIAQVNGLRAKIPYGETPEARTTAIENFQNAARKDKKLTAHRQLACDDREAFHQSADPVLAVGGLKADRPLTRTTPLPCRPTSQLITQYTAGGSTMKPPASPPGAERLTGLNTAMLALLKEFWLLDQAVLTDCLGSMTIPAAQQRPEYLGIWRQPWAPFYLMWETEYLPTPLSTDGLDRWEFDSTRYRWKGLSDKETITPFLLSGRSILSPQLTHTAGSRAAHYARLLSEQRSAPLRKLAEGVNDWPVLTQAMSDVDMRLTHRRAGVALAPPDSALAALMPQAAPYVPEPDPISETDPRRRFHHVRAGQLGFTHLVVVDRFGRTCVMTSTVGEQYLSFQPRPAACMVVDHYAQSVGKQRLVQVPPRLAQPARLRMEFVNHRNDAELVVPADGRFPAESTPICGWLQTSRYLGESLLVYDPTGQPLGEIRIRLDLRRQAELGWLPFPDSPYPTFDSAISAGDSPQLGGLLKGLKEGGKAAFKALLSALDNSPASRPQPNRGLDLLAGLVGNPVALLRIRLFGELDRPPQLDPTVRNVTTPPVQEMPGRWNVRLGGRDHDGDGLAGFFVGTDYNQFFLVPDSTSPNDREYLRPITGTEFALAFNTNEAAAGATAYATLLCDPWAPVHAVTDILPVSSLQLPDNCVQDVLVGLRVPWRLGPVLAATTTIDGGVGVQMPRPSQATGTWMWHQQTTVGGKPAWATSSIVPADGALRHPVARPIARDGYLRLADPLVARRRHLPDPVEPAVSALKRDETLNGMSGRQGNKFPHSLTAKATHNGETVPDALIRFTITDDTGSYFAINGERQRTCYARTNDEGLAVAADLWAEWSPVKPGPHQFHVEPTAPDSPDASKDTYQLSVINP